MTLIERLRQPVLHYATCHEAADLIEQQSARIAELEADLYESNSELDLKRNELEAACIELAALRRKIDEAPVVAHISHNGQVFSNGFVYETDKPLISKEDLK